MPIEFRPLKTSHCPEFQELLAIYHDSFPPEERQPDSVLQENIDSGLSCAFIAVDQNHVIFFLHAYHVPQTSLVFLDYAATHPAYRGQQICRHFFEQAFSLFGQDRILFCQQEDPHYGENRSVKRQRIAYFGSLGFQYLDGITFMLPDHSGGTHLTPMVLSAMASNPMSILPGQLVAKAIRFIFLQVYRRHEDDELLHQNLGVIPNEIVLSEPLSRSRQHPAKIKLEKRGEHAESHRADQSLVNEIAESIPTEGSPKPVLRQAARCPLHGRPAMDTANVLFILRLHRRRRHTLRQLS